MTSVQQDQKVNLFVTDKNYQLSICLGNTGDQGPQGIIGLKGEIGAQGPTGDGGINGTKGDVGVTGDKGDEGIEGKPTNFSHQQRSVRFRIRSKGNSWYQR